MAKRSFSIFRKSLFFLESLVLISVLSILSFFVPYEKIYDFSVFIGRIFYRFSLKSQTLIKKNIEIIYPDKIIEHAFLLDIGGVVCGSQLRIILEMIALSRMSFQEIFSYLEFSDHRVIADILNKKKKVSLALTLHYGNWELGSIILSLCGFSVLSLAERQFNPFINAFLFHLRNKLGIHTVYNEISNMRSIFKHLKNDLALIGMVADQIHWYDPIFVPFFGKEVAVPKGVAQLFCKTESNTILFGYTKYLSSGRYQVYFPVLSDLQCTNDTQYDVSTIMTQIYQKYEQVILSDVKHWYTLGTDRWGFDRDALRLFQANPDSDPF